MREGVRVQPAIDGISKEHSAEKHHFGGEENPHAERYGFALLFNIFELMCDDVRFAMQLAAPSPANPACTDTVVRSQQAFPRNSPAAEVTSSATRVRSLPMD